jgi:hypothetical protein
VKLPDAPAPAPGPVSHAAADLPPPSALAPSRIGVEPPQGQVSTRAPEPERSAIAAPRQVSAASSALRIAPGRATPIVIAPIPRAMREPLAIHTEDEAYDAFIAKANLRFADGPQMSRDALLICAAHFGRPGLGCAACPVRAQCDAAARSSDAQLQAAIDRLNAAAYVRAEPVDAAPIRVRRATCACGAVITAGLRGILPKQCPPCRRTSDLQYKAQHSRDVRAARSADSEPPPPKPAPPTRSAPTRSSPPADFDAAQDRLDELLEAPWLGDRGAIRTVSFTPGDS